MLEYRSVQDLNRLIAENLERFRGCVDLVVGAPRSGMLPATLLALYLNLPLCDLDGYLEGRPAHGGQRSRDATEARASAPSSCRRVLVMDDSSLTGRAIAEIRDRVDAGGVSDDAVTYAVAYVHPSQRAKVDVWLEQLSQRVFEWNMPDHPILAESLVDMRGVLCSSSPWQKAAHGSWGWDERAGVRPLVDLSYVIGWVVADGPEHRREDVEAWLRAHRLRHDRIIMLGDASSVAGNSREDVLAAAYRRVSARLCLEGEPRAAAIIAKLSRKPVYCTRNHEMYYHVAPATLVQREAVANALPECVRRRLPRTVKNAVRRLIGTT